MEKIGIIDLGSNSARLVLANVLEGGYYVVFDQLKESVRLGQDMLRDGFLKPARVAQAIKTLKMFRKLCDAYNVDKIFAVATSAIRRAKNQRSFLEEVNATCGFKLKVLTEEEEITHIYQGVINSLDIPKGLILDISGGSVQMVYYNRRNILHHETLPFGPITLNDMFNDSILKPEEQTQKIVEFFLEQLANIPWLKEIEPDVQLIGVGGSMRNLARISRRLRRYPLEQTHNYVVKLDDFNNIYDTIRVLEAEKRLKIRGLSSGRADIFAGAIACIKGFLDYTNYQEIVISACGLREGIMLNYVQPITTEKPLSDVLGYSLNTLIRHYDEVVHHVEHVYNLSMQLYKQLRVLHKLPRGYVKVLRAASLLHDAGMRIKYYDHQKHSCYMILNSTLYGLTHREIVLAAFVAAAHRKEELSPSELIKYKDLITEEDIAAIVKLGVILRIAESLDRTMSGAVKTLNCDVLGDSVIMKTEVEGDCSLEIKDALTAGGEFYKAYHKNLEIL